MPWPGSSAQGGADDFGRFSEHQNARIYPKVPGLAAALGKGIWHLVVYISGFAMFVAEGEGFLPD